MFDILNERRDRTRMKISCDGLRVWEPCDLFSSCQRHPCPYPCLCSCTLPHAPPLPRASTTLGWRLPPPHHATHLQPLPPQPQPPPITGQPANTPPQCPPLLPCPTVVSHRRYHLPPPPFHNHCHQNPLLHPPMSESPPGT